MKTKKKKEYAEVISWLENLMQYLSNWNESSVSFLWLHFYDSLCAILMLFLL
jgi:hypothetical protein